MTVPLHSPTSAEIRTVDSQSGLRIVIVMITCKNSRELMTSPVSIKGAYVSAHI